MSQVIKVVFHILIKTKRKFSKYKTEGQWRDSTQFSKNGYFKCKFTKVRITFDFFIFSKEKSYECIYVFVFDWEYSG